MKKIYISSIALIVCVLLLIPKVVYVQSYSNNTPSNTSSILTSLQDWWYTEYDNIVDPYIQTETGFVYVGEHVTIEPNASGIITYTSLTPDIASVDQNGIITGLKEGEARIKIHVDADDTHREQSQELKILVKTDGQLHVGENIYTTTKVYTFIPDTSGMYQFEMITTKNPTIFIINEDKEYEPFLIGSKKDNKRKCVNYTYLTKGIEYRVICGNYTEGKNIFNVKISKNDVAANPLETGTIDIDTDKIYCLDLKEDKQYQIKCLEKWDEKETGIIYIFNDQMIKKTEKGAFDTSTIKLNKGKYYFAFYRDKNKTLQLEIKDKENTINEIKEEKKDTFNNQILLIGCIVLISILGILFIKMKRDR